MGCHTATFPQDIDACQYRHLSKSWMTLPQEDPAVRSSPRHLSEVQEDGDLVVTVCDRAQKELGHLLVVHWSVPDPVPAGDPGSFDAVLAELRHRIERFVPRLAPAP